MYEQPEFGVIIVVALYAIAGVLAVVGGIMAMRLRRKKRHHD